ncbi:ABC transporter ATP-binding protein [Halomontanus rarus]|uniref:ABC transporter ATP-binding protein n=1 Tax=Halomontanus rarus TaxID=3034020 RepID=UPI00293C012E|nr:ABC transporter ATP-binding protein [Halovivax sp. KZCA124]
MSRSQEPVVSLQDVEIHFGGESSILPWRKSADTVRAVDNVSLDIYPNDVVALVGESGCGKTTLGKSAVGLQRPTNGSIKYRSQDIWEAKDGQGQVDIPYNEIREALQIIHQDPGASINPNKKVIKILSVPLRERQPELSRADREARIYSMLETVGMTPAGSYAHRYPHQLSGGEQQRVALIRALLMNPDLILADEAVSALDVSLRIEMMDLMLELQDQFDTSFLFISHNLSNARYFTKKVGGRIGVMYLGELVEIGPTDQIINNPQHPYTQILKWATPGLDIERSEVEDPPLRTIDVPDPTNKPSGCPFHTRCPEAREVCTTETPNLVKGRVAEHQVACFRSLDNHEYWDSPELSATTPKQ